jgi:hypothetical protein
MLGNVNQFQAFVRPGTPAWRLARIDTIINLGGGLGVGPCVLLDGIVWVLPPRRLFSVVVHRSANPVFLCV